MLATRAGEEMGGIFRGLLKSFDEIGSVLTGEIRIFSGSFEITSPPRFSSEIDYGSPESGPSVSDIHYRTCFVSDVGTGVPPERSVERHGSGNREGKVSRERRLIINTVSSNTVSGFGPPIVPDGAESLNRRSICTQTVDLLG